MASKNTERPKGRPRFGAADAVAALAPLLAEKCILLDEAHGRALMVRLAEAGRHGFDPAARVPSSDASASGGESFQRLAGGVARIAIVGDLTKYPSFFSLIDEFLGLCPAMTVIGAIGDALDDPGITSIILDIDSPGGFVNGSVELADAVAAANEVKPVTAFVGGLCCSGAYWIASQADRIVARPEAWIGGIGVYGVLADVSECYAAMGIDLTLVSTGQFKGLGEDGKVGEDMVSDSRRMVNGIYQQFTAAVAAGRGMKLDDVVRLSDGRAYLGPEAKQLGLIDEVASSFDATVEALVGAGAPESSAMFKRKTSAAPAAAAGNAAAPLAASGEVEEKPPVSADPKKEAEEKPAEAEAEGDEREEQGKATAAPAPESSAPSAAARPDSAAYMTAFGDVGARWYLEGKPFAACAGEFIAGMRKQHGDEAEAMKAAHKAEADGLRAQVDDLNVKLDAAPRGNEPAAFSAEGKGGAAGEQEKKLEQKLGSPGLAKMASGMKFAPGAEPQPTKK